MNPTTPSRMQVILARLPALRYTAEKPFSVSAGAARGASPVQVCIATAPSRLAGPRSPERPRRRRSIP